jgi:hypothetical protein
MAVSDIVGLDDLKYTSFTPSGSTVETVRVTVDGVTVAVTVTGPKSNPVWDPKEAPIGGDWRRQEAGSGARDWRVGLATYISSLGSCRSAIELHPRGCG